MTGTAFSVAVSQSAWRDRAEAWIGAALGELGAELTGPITQPRIRPWSTQLIVPTTAGHLWFKALAPSMHHEPALQARLAQVAPEIVDAPVAIDPARGWMLTRDRGTTLGDLRPPTQDDWCRIVEVAARLQQRLTPHAADLLATGLPDCRPSSVADRFDRLIDLFAGLPDTHPSHLDPETVRSLEATRPRVVAACDRLNESVLPVTWQHGDLHPWNLFEIDGALRPFDFGDGQWAHALEILEVPRAQIAERADLSIAKVEAAWAAVWDLHPADLTDDLAAIRLTRPVNRALTWWACLETATAEEWRTWGAAPRDHLLGVLDRAG